ncbi:MAG TPA: VWA domain-containing protein [Vicinamibacterales bacterium]|nr:VWA domain-containing protein [Vicinamibacterales bacterium]
MRARLAALTIWLAGTSLLAQNQTTSPPQSTFRGGVHFVRVDMYASRNGSPVTDLEAAEVEIREDGVLQKVEAFEHVSVPAGGPEATRVEPNSIRAGREMASDPRARVFVLFLDSYHMDAQTAVQAQTPIRRFLEEALGPDDLVAVVTPEMSINDLTFTRRTTIISGLLGKIDEFLLRDRTAATRIVPLDATERMYEKCNPLISDEMILRRREKLTLDSLNDLAVHLGSIREERKTVLVVTLGWTLYGPNLKLADRSTGGTPPIAPIDRLTGGRGRGGTESSATQSEQMACEADRVALANLDDRERIRDITGDANRANVSFYPITPLRNPTFSPAGSLSQLSALREMAVNTDGVPIVNTNNLAEPIQRLVADMSSYYLVGYQSTNARLDGRFRNIKVTVKRPGVEVRARSGYRAVSEADLRSAAPAAAPSAPRPPDTITKALSSVASAATTVPLRLRSSAWTRAAGAGSEGMLWISGELDASTRREPGWAAGATAEITVGSADGRALRRTVTLAPGTFAFAVRVPDGESAAPGSYDVRVSVRPAGNGSPVSDHAAVTIPATASAIGEGVLLRRSPATGTRYVETADLRFARNERLRLELPSSSSATAEAHVVDRAGQTTQVPAQVSTRPDPGGKFQWVVVDVTLAPFAAGDYAVTVTQEGATQVVGFRVTQ